MDNIFFTADTHFGSVRILELSRRPFKTIAQMDSEIINRWNRVISNDDTVYHLGDFGDPEVLQLLNGHVIFLPGNYDTMDIICILSDYHVERPDEKYVSVIAPNTDIDDNGERIRLIHEPDEAVGSDCFYLFGHIHKLQMVKRNGLNVGVDCHDFTPIPIGVVRFYKNAIEKHYDENVFMPRI